MIFALQEAGDFHAAPSLHLGEVAIRIETDIHNRYMTEDERRRELAEAMNESQRSAEMAAEERRVVREGLTGGNGEVEEEWRGRARGAIDDAAARAVGI